MEPILRILRQTLLVTGSLLGMLSSKANNIQTTNGMMTGGNGSQIFVQYGLCAVHGLVDQDGDGFLSTGDCNDTDPGINPMATQDVCDGIDNDCNGQVNEGFNVGQACGTNGIIVCDGNGGTTCQEQ